MTNPQNSKITFADTENYHGGGSDNVLSKPQLVMKQLSECVAQGGKELHGGGVKTRIINGDVVQIAVANEREKFFREVEMLWILVKPDYDNLSDERKAPIKKRIEDCDKELELVDSEYKKSIKNIGVQRSFGLKQNSDNNYFNKLNSNLKGTIDWYELEKVRIFQAKLLAINYLLSELNYYGEVSVIG